MWKGFILTVVEVRVVTPCAPSPVPQQKSSFFLSILHSPNKSLESQTGLTLAFYKPNAVHKHVLFCPRSAKSQLPSLKKHDFRQHS